MIKIDTTKEKIEAHIKKLKNIIEELKKSGIVNKKEIILKHKGNISAWEEVLDLMEEEIDMKNYNKMTLGNRKNYAIARLKKAISKKSVSQELIDLIDSTVIDKCFQCAWNDFGKCMTQNHIMYDFNYSDKMRRMECAKQALKFLTFEKRR